MQGIDSDLIRGHIDTIILNILGEGDKYGYEICKEVEIKSNGAYELKQPTLYSCLKRLESQGLISSYWEDSDIGGKRHYYKLTENGLKTYKKNQEDWKRSKQIIDTLISEENLETVPTPLDNNETLKEKDIDEEFVDETDDDELIFDKMDKEVEVQDSGSFDYGNEFTYLNNETDSEKAQENGFESVKDASLPFDNTDYNSYCTHLVKNEPQEETSEKTDEATSETDDIMELLGHFDNSRKSSSLLSKYAGDAEPINTDLNLSQEDEFLAKFITGKYSEFNPNKDEYIDVLRERSIENEEQNEPINDLISTDLSGIDDEKEFSDEDTTSSKISSYFDDVNAEKLISSENKTENIENTNNFADISNKKVDNITIVDETISDNEEEIETKNEEIKQSPYNNITYFNLNKPIEEEIKSVSKEDALQNFASKYDAEILEDVSNDDVYLDFTKSQEDDKDKIIMDFTNENVDETQNNNYSDYDENNEDNYSSFMAELDENGVNPSEVQPFENKIDLTSVYDKTGNSNISPTYTDNEVKEKLNELAGNNINSILFNDEQKNQNELMVDTTIEGYFKSTEKQPKDLTILKADLQQEGITVRPYYKTIKEPTSTKTFIETNKIKMVRNWIVFFIEAVLLGITLLIVNKLNFTENTFIETYIYFVCGLAFMLILAMYSTIKYWINPYKKVTSKYAPRISHLFALLFTVQFFVIIYCINLQFGFYSFSQTNYNHLNWIVPCVVSLFPILQSITYEILYKSKNFHI